MATDDTNNSESGKACRRGEHATSRRSMLRWVLSGLAAVTFKGMGAKANALPASSPMPPPAPSPTVPASRDLQSWYVCPEVSYAVFVPESEPEEVLNWVIDWG